MKRRRVTEAMAKRWLGENLERLRAEQGKTQQQAADAADLDLRHYQKAEYGELNATLNTLAKLSNAFGVDVTVLLERPPRR